MNISNINNLNSITNLNKSNNTAKEKGTDFSAMLSDALENVNNLQTESTKATESFINGETDNIHSVMLTSSKANLALQMTIQVRNKVMDAYNEIMNMQV